LRPNKEDEPVGVTILVEDNGPGIPKDEIDTIFERGYRGINTSNTTVGSGIGLDISKEMMGKIGGNLKLIEKKSSKEYKGTVMKFTLYRRPKI
jgi:signal transduction histidine kinase